MQAIRSKDTKIELLLRKELWRRGLRYRKNRRDLPGKPDIVFGPAKVAVFCDSEFWHGFDWENRKSSIKTNREFWIPKIERNIERDRENDSALNEIGYTVIRFWGKEIQRDVSACADKIEYYLGNNKPLILISPMRQFRTEGCDTRLTPYTERDRSKITYCVYCGETADTSEHVPPRAFLDDVIPDPAPTLPACSKCNNHFSKDEEYVACTIDCLKSCVSPEYAVKKKTIRSLMRSIGFAKRVEQQFIIEGDANYFGIDRERFRNIMIKLAKGHACYQLDRTGPLDCVSVEYCFSFEMDYDSYYRFNSEPVVEIIPDLGSRSFSGFIFTVPGNVPKYPWSLIQPERYRYLAYCDRDGYCVRIVIDEFFLCSVRFN